LRNKLSKIYSFSFMWKRFCYSS